MKSPKIWVIIMALWMNAIRLFSIEAYIQPVVFYSADLRPYLEMRILIDHNGFVKTIKKDSFLSIKALVTISLKKGQDFIKVERFLIENPPGKDLMPLIHQIRWFVEPGEYQLETAIQDGNDSTRELSLINPIHVMKPFQTAFISDIQLSLISNEKPDSNHILFKNGFYSEPLKYHHLNPNQNILFAYLETYKSESLGNKYVLKFLIHKKDSTGNLKFKEEWFVRRSGNRVDPYLLKHDISTFTTGTYVFTVQLLNLQSQKLFEQKVEFTRDNPFWDKMEILYQTRFEDKLFFDTLSLDVVDYAIRGVYPMISSLDVSVLNNLFKNKKEEEKRAFLFAYWSERSDSAQLAFNKFLNYLKSVDQLFYSGFGYGFETDRGIIYLRYGKPDEIIAEDKENGAYPYEIWKYNKVKTSGQTNVKFLFYNPDLAGSDFRLLHSTAHGERQNKRWEIELYKNAIDEFKGDNLLDATEMQPGINRRAKEYFEH